MDGSARDITTLLGLADTDPDAQDELFRLVEARFRQIAHSKMRHERPDHTLQSTVLADDAFLKLMRGQRFEWQNREQFFSTAAKIMRQLLVDYDRLKKAQKRGGGEKAARIGQVADPEDDTRDPQDLVALDEVLRKLEVQQPEVFQVFDLHYFAQFSLREIADEILKISYDTVKTRWHLAKGFLHRELTGEALRDG